MAESDLSGFKRGDNRNRHEHFSSFEVVPWIGALGAEVRQLSLSDPLGGKAQEELRAAFSMYRVLSFRGQSLTPEDYLRFATTFGAIGSYPFAAPLDGYPGIVPVMSDGTGDRNFGGIWHLDSPYFESPPVATLLYGIAIPDSGGDTVFSDLCSAYQALSPGMRRMLGGLNAVYTAAAVHGHGASDVKLGSVRRLRDLEMAEREQIRPIVDTHPRTGEPILSISRFHISRFEGMTEQESAPLLDYLAAHSVHPIFTSRIRWEEGTVVLLDNRCVLHMGLNDYPGRRREVHRIVLNAA